tara:strand:+ start:3181 stop:3624 length:444 start_codon:yes stop_codon:yes gene_type:complete
MNNLIEIGKKYPSNKNRFGFIQIYEKYFNDIRNDKINILEIGIDRGDSLRIWRDYFPNAKNGGSRLRLNKFNTSMNFLKRLTDCINYEHNDRPFYKKSKFDGMVKYIHFYQNIVFVKKEASKKYYHPNKKQKSFINSIKKLFSKVFY